MLPAAQLHLKETPVVVLWHMWASAEYGNISKYSWGPLPVGVLASLPEESPETQKSIQEEQRGWLEGSVLLAQAKAPDFLKGHNACCYWESQEASMICVLQEKCPEGFFSAAESLQLFLFKPGPSVPWSSLAYTETCLSLVRLLHNLTLKWLPWSQPQAGQSISSQQGTGQTIQAEKSAPQTTGISLFF